MSDYTTTVNHNEVEMTELSRRPFPSHSIPDVAMATNAREVEMASGLEDEDVGMSISQEDESDMHISQDIEGSSGRTGFSALNAIWGYISRPSAIKHQAPSHPSAAQSLQSSFTDSPVPFTAEDGVQQRSFSATQQPIPLTAHPLTPIPPAAHQLTPNLPATPPLTPLVAGQTAQHGFQQRSFLVAQQPIPPTAHPLTPIPPVAHSLSSLVAQSDQPVIEEHKSPASQPPHLPTIPQQYTSVPVTTATIETLVERRKNNEPDIEPGKRRRSDESAAPRSQPKLSNSRIPETVLKAKSQKLNLAYKANSILQAQLNRSQERSNQIQFEGTSRLAELLNNQERLRAENSQLRGHLTSELLTQHMVEEGEARLREMQQSQERLRAENAALRGEMQSVSEVMDARLVEALEV
jgi:hypothetical protein